MMTSLPTTTPENCPAAFGTAPAGALSGDLAALLAAAAPAASGSPATSLNFGAILGPDATVAETPAPMVAATATPVGTPSALPRVAATMEQSEPAAIAPDRPTHARGVTVTNAGRKVVLAPSAPSAPAAPDRTTLEHALALLLPLVAPLATAAPGAPGTPSENNQAADTPAGTNTACVTLALPGRPRLVLSGVNASSAPAQMAEQLATAADAALPVAARTTPEAADTPLRPTDAVPTIPTPTLPVTQNTASEPSGGMTPPPAPPASHQLPSQTISLDRAVAANPAPAGLKQLPDLHANPSPMVTPSVPTDASLLATVELPDGAVLQIAVPFASRADNAAKPRVAPVAAGRAEKSAAVPARLGGDSVALKNNAGKNFLNAKAEEVSLLPQKAGIGVAETTAPMFLPPHAALPTVEPTVVAHAAVETVAVAERVPMPELTAASLAHRAVDAVTNVVEAQAAAKLQPVPSVQLKFRVGTDDLAVRVELRAGVVRTEFRTDSPELRTALTQEWNAVVAQPESALRYLEPVFAPATSRGHGEPTDLPGNPQQFSQQHTAQQQHQQPQQHARTAAEFFGSVARSTPYQPRDGGAASPAVVPLVAPTSHHLSAVA